MIEIDENDPRQLARGLIVVCDSLSQMMLAVSAVNRPTNSTHLLNQAPNDGFVYGALHRGGDDDGVLAGHDLIAEKHQLLRLFGSRPRHHCFSQVQSALEKIAYLLNASGRRNRSSFRTGLQQQDFVHADTVVAQ